MILLHKEYLRFLEGNKYHFPSLELIAKQLGLHRNYLPELKRIKSDLVDRAKEYLKVSLKNEKKIKKFKVVKMGRQEDEKELEACNQEREEE